MSYHCPSQINKPTEMGTSIKYSGKYLGMAEMVGPLDLEADCGFWTDKRDGNRGLIPIRWIVTKDVPFSKFQDLKYHEQHITQVRHGNTIPGEVGRLVIQRYFEAPHGPTATLHSLSQSSRHAEALESQNTILPRMGRKPRRSSLPQRHEVSRTAFGTFQHRRGRFSGALRGGLHEGSRPT